MKVALILLVVLAGIILVPALLIWALNTLFPVSIAFTFVNWLAAFVLIGIFSGSSASRN